MTMFGVAGLTAPVIGPTLGGYITVNYNWRWIFLINLPIGVVGYLMCHFAVDDPDYLKKERAELSRRPLYFDSIGLGLLALAMTCWEVLLSKGQEWDWYNDPFWRVQTLFVLFVLSLGALVFRELRIANPVVNFRPLGERNLAAASIIIFCAYGVLYGASVSLPSLLQSLFGYDAFVSGLVMSPSGVFSILMMLVVGVLVGRGTDARWLIAAGLLVMAAGCYWMARMNLYISPWYVVWPRVVLVVGLSLLFAPINVAAFRYTPQHLRGAAVGLFALLRNEGGSVGMSIAKIIEQRREQFHLARVGENLGPLNTHVQSFFNQGQAFFMQRTGDPARSQQIDPPVARRSPPAAGRVHGLLRRLLAVRRPEPGTRAFGTPDEALGGREGGAHWGGVDRRAWESIVVEGYRQLGCSGDTILIPNASPRNVSVPGTPYRSQTPLHAT